jgi:hypothetical protein
MRVQTSNSHRRENTVGGVQSRTVRGGSGFLSQDPFLVHLGLGGSQIIDKIEIHWPSGR